MREFKMALKLNKLIKVIFWILCVLPATSCSDVIEVTEKNLTKILDSTHFLVLYISKRDFGGDLFYPRFLIASQNFKAVEDVTFGHVRDSRLYQTLDVRPQHLPLVRYYTGGSDVPEKLRGDFTVDNIHNTIRGRLGPYIHDVNIRYTVQLTDENFETVIEKRSPEQIAMVLLSDCEAHSYIGIFEDLAKTFRNDENILLGQIDSSQNEKLAHIFAAHKYPKLYWYERSSKAVRKLYGGRLDIQELTNFINDQTHLDREPSGELKPTAGRIPEMDKLAREWMPQIYLGDRLELVIDMFEDAGRMVAYNRRYVEYYINIITVVERAGSIDALTELDHRLAKQLTKGNLSPKQLDEVHRRKNILAAFLAELPGLTANDDWQRVVREHRTTDHQRRVSLPRQHRHSEL